ncbi:hypothetical protein FRC09_019036, partial [Ceratobasidium sp. 395]
MNHHEIPPHCSQKDGRDAFVRSSLSSTRFVAERILSLSASKSRDRPFVMDFNSRWWHPDCPVVGWYNQQCVSITRFRSIEHRKDIEGPFFHQFLLLKLTDGTVCRVERTGQGSHLDAIRDVGCTAKDLIQWFSQPDYEAFSARFPSERIAEVGLGQEFDILDVLAVCYSIQRTKACSRYTLQRYNCYFLCLTILVVLTRRAASWETNIKSDEWDSRLTSVYEGWSSLSPDQAKQHAILRICEYLEPNNPQSAQFVFDMLRGHLGSRAEGFAQCNKAIELTLWSAGWESAFRAGLLESLNLAIPNHLEGTGYCSEHLDRAVKANSKNAKREIMSCEALLAKNYFKFVAEEEAIVYARTYQLFKDFQRRWLIKHPVSFNKLVLGPMVGGLWADIVTTMILLAGNRYDEMLYSQAPLQEIRLRQIRRRAKDDVLGRSDAMADLWGKAGNIAHNELGGSYIVRILDGLASTGVFPPSEVSLVIALWLKTDRLAALLASLATSGLNNMLPVLMEAHQTDIQLAQGGLEPGNIHSQTT